MTGGPFPFSERPGSADGSMKFFIRTLGCKMNGLDSARLRAALLHGGHEEAGREEEADYVVVNSCTVTAEADRKSRQAVNAAGRRRQRVAVTGCGPRVDPERWHQQAGDAVFPSGEALLDHLGAPVDALPFPVHGRTRAPVAVQQGCDNRCSFCITRLARGAHRSLPAEEVVAQVRQAEAAGAREVVLTGINLAAWGAEDSNAAAAARLHELLEAVLGGTTIPRIRLSSLGPQYLGPGFFRVFADPRICDYLHLSVQSGSPEVLRRMDRGHGVEEVLEAARAARRVRPDVAVAADLIVGFPGESEADFEQTRALAEEAGLAKLHVFPYSARAGTPAAEWGPVVAAPEKKRRAARLRETGRGLRRAFLQRQYGRPAEVLAEAGGTGLTGNYIRVHTAGSPAGRLHRLTVTPEQVAERG